MTKEEFNVAVFNLLKRLPDEFHTAILNLSGDISSEDFLDNVDTLTKELHEPCRRIYNQLKDSEDRLAILENEIERYQ